MNVTRWGTGEAFVLVHGLGGSAAEWTQIEARLSGGYTLDLPRLRDDTRLLPAAELTRLFQEFATKHPDACWVAHSYAAHAVVRMTNVRAVVTIGAVLAAPDTHSLMLAGRDDPAFAEREHVVFIDNAGHAPHLDQPVEVARRIRMFVDGLS